MPPSRISLRSSMTASKLPIDIRSPTGHNITCVKLLGFSAARTGMALLDHFHAPVHPKWPWESFHSAWATEIMKALNAGLLPPGYLAFAQVQMGERIEVDVAAEEDRESVSANSAGGATLSLPMRFPDSIEVRVVDPGRDGKVAAAIELVSPRNKDGRAARRAD